MPRTPDAFAAIGCTNRPEISPANREQTIMKKKSEFLKTLLDYNPNYDIKLIERAYDVAEEMHRGQLRKSG